MGKSRFLGEFEQLVLLAILRLGEQAYGTTIRQILLDVIQRDVSIGALYTTLTRLEDKGLIRSAKGEATAERGGRAKKYFEILLKYTMCHNFYEDWLKISPFTACIGKLQKKTPKIQKNPKWPVS